jgi:hypothetical protein
VGVPLNGDLLGPCVYRERSLCHLCISRMPKSNVNSFGVKANTPVARSLEWEEGRVQA